MKWWSRPKHGSFLSGRAWIIPLVLGTLASGALAGQRLASGWFGGNRAADSRAAGVDTPCATVTALGRLEPEGGVIEVGGVAGERIGQLLVKEGEQVRAGQELAHLAGRTLYLAEQRQAEAALAQLESQARAAEVHGDALIAEAELALRQSGEPQQLEIQAQTAQIELLKANLEVARKDRSRLVALGKDIVSSQQLDHQTLLEKRAVQELQAAEHQLARLRATVDVRRDQAQAQLATARAAKNQVRASIAIESARRSVESARLRYDLATIRAPRAGQVFKVLAQEGETLAGPLLEMGDTRRFVVRAEVFETDILHVKAGQKVEIVSRALGDKQLSGQVEAVLWMVARNSVRSLDPLAASDVRVVDVVMRVDDAEAAARHEILSRLVGLQVDVRIDTRAAP